MQVRALESFVDESGRHAPGDVFAMDDALAVVRMRDGLVARIADEPETTAAQRDFEMAVNRRTRR